MFLEGFAADRRVATQATDGRAHLLEGAFEGNPKLIKVADDKDREAKTRDSEDPSKQPGQAQDNGATVPRTAAQRQFDAAFKSLQGAKTREEFAERVKKAAPDFEAAINTADKDGEKALKLWQDRDHDHPEIVVARNALDQCAASGAAAWKTVPLETKAQAVQASVDFLMADDEKIRQAKLDELRHI